MKKLFALLPLAAFALTLSLSHNTHVEVVNAEDDDVVTMTAQTFLKNIWNSDGEADAGFFKYYVGHGSLSVGEGDKHGYYPMTKSLDSEGNFTGRVSTIDWGAQRYNSEDDDRIQLKIRTSAPISLSVTGLENPTGWCDGGECELSYYAIQGEDVNNGKWYTADKKVSMNTSSTTANELNYQVSLGAGDTFVMEFGFRWGGIRNWANAGTGISFSITKQASEFTLYYSEMVTAVATKGDDVDDVVAPFASYGFYHGNLRNSSIEKMTSDAENHLVGDYVQTYHYGAEFHNNDSLIVKIVASEHMVLNIQRLEKGTEWLAGCYLRYWVNTTEVMTQEFDSEPDASVFDAYIVLNTNDVFYMEVGFPWGDTRKMNMLNDGDIRKSLPQFNGYGTVNSEFLTNAKDASTTVASAIVCYNGTQNPTLDGYTWDQLSDLYNGLDEKAKALMSQGTYTIENGSAIATNGTSQEVANAVAKYDQLVAKYSYSDFMGRNPQIVTGLNSVSMNGDSSTMIIIICISASALAVLTSICVIRKKRHCK